jgi:hypothetical protein
MFQLSLTAGQSATNLVDVIDLSLSNDSVEILAYCLV